MALTGAARRYLLWLRYDGSKFPEMAKGGSKYGVMDLVDSVLSTTFQKGIKLAPSSRTDAGVHALRNTAIVHVPDDSEYRLDSALQRADLLNHWNSTIKTCAEGLELLHFHPVSPGFCARKNVSYRRYVYRLAIAKSEALWNDINERPHPACFSERNYCWLLPPGFNAQSSQSAANLFIGTRNMASFFKYPERARRKETEFPTTLRSMLHVQVGQGAAYSMDNEIFDYYNVTIVSRSFLREQIRRMMAVIVGAGYGRHDEALIKWLLDNPKPWNFFDRKIKVAPPQGLFLADVVYDERMFQNPVPAFTHGWDFDCADEIDC